MRQRFRTWLLENPLRGAIALALLITSSSLGIQLLIKGERFFAMLWEMFALHVSLGLILFLFLYVRLRQIHIDQ